MQYTYARKAAAMATDDTDLIPTGISDTPGPQASPAVPATDTAPWRQLEGIPEHLILVVGTLGSGKSNRGWRRQKAPGSAAET
jgi:hypothetical protein